MDAKKKSIPMVAAVHDLAAYGRCSLSVVIPTLSAMGYQVIPLPTALLSTHTGDFTGYSFLDLTDEMPRMAAHWKKLELSFRGIYTGFLGSARQIDFVRTFLSDFRRDNTFVLIDPVMGDDGAVYATYTKEMCAGMRELVCHADLICPNLTEAYILLDTPYLDPLTLTDEQRRRHYRDMAHALFACAGCNVIITGCDDRAKDGHLLTGNISCCKDEGVAFSMLEKIPVSYPGTGECFASVLLGKLLDGSSLSDATAFASAFVHDVMFDSVSVDEPANRGVQLERNLSRLIPQECRNALS